MAALSSLRPALVPRAPEPGRLILGRDKAGAPLPLDARLLAAHIDMVGGTGAGKSATMRHFGWEHVHSDPKFKRATVIVDPHGAHPDSLLRTTLRRIVQTRLYERKRVFVIDANSHWCVGLRLLDGAAVVADHMIEASSGSRTIKASSKSRRWPQPPRPSGGPLGAQVVLAQADLLLDPSDAHGIREWGLQKITDRYAVKAMLRLQYLAQDPRLHKEFEIETIGTGNRMAPVLSSRAIAPRRLANDRHARHPRQRRGSARQHCWR